MIKIRRHCPIGFVNWINGGESESGELVNEETAMKMSAVSERAIIIPLSSPRLYLRWV